MFALRPGISKVVSPLSRPVLSHGCSLGPELLVNLRDYDYSLDLWSLGCMFAGMVRSRRLSNVAQPSLHPYRFSRFTLSSKERTITINW